MIVEAQNEALSAERGKLPGDPPTIIPLPVATRVQAAAYQGYPGHNMNDPRSHDVGPGAQQTRQFTISYSCCLKINFREAQPSSRSRFVNMVIPTDVDRCL